MGRGKENLVWDGGEVVNGMSFTTVRGRERFYYRDQNKKQQWLGYDKAVAIARFKALTDGPAKRLAKFAGRVHQINDGLASGGPLYRDDVKHIQEFHEEEWRRNNASLVRDWLLNDPVDAAKRTGIPELACWPTWKAPEPSPTLESLLNVYLEKKRFRTDHERSVSKLFWNHFSEIVGVKTVRELSKQIMTDYAEKILAEYDRDDDAKRSQTWVKHRYGKVKGVLRFALKHCTEADMADITRAMSYCQIFELPPAPDPDPRPIDPAHFRKLHDAADDLDKAIMLFALNCCMYAEEVKYAKKKWIKGNTLAGYRYKKGKIPRIAMLWGRTTEVMAKLPGHDRETVFDITTRQIQRRFKKLRERVGLNDVEFRHIRDGSYTKMDDVSTGKAAEMVAGHKTGVKDRYVLRHPETAAEVCAAVERHYFPESQLQMRNQALIRQGPQQAFSNPKGSAGLLQPEGQNRDLTGRGGDLQSLPGRGYCLRRELRGGTGGDAGVKGHRSPPPRTPRHVLIGSVGRPRR